MYVVTWSLSLISRTTTKGWAVPILFFMVVDIMAIVLRVTLFPTRILPSMSVTNIGDRLIVKFPILLEGVSIWLLTASSSFIIEYSLLSTFKVKVVMRDDASMLDTTSSNFCDLPASRSIGCEKATATIFLFESLKALTTLTTFAVPFP